MRAPGPYVAITIALVGFTLFAALHHLHLWFARRERLSLLFGLCCLPFAINCAAQVGIATASNLEAGQRALDIRTMSGLLAQLMIAALIGEITGVRARAYRWGLAALFAIGLLTDLFAFSLAGRVSELVRLEMPWGEALTILTRQAGDSTTAQWLPRLIYLAIVTIQIYAFIGARALWHRDRTSAVLITAAAVGGLAGSVVGLLIDTQTIRGPYMGQLPVAFWVLLMALLLSREHARRGELLEASERRFRAIFDQTFQFIGLLDASGRVVEANRTALEFAGISHDAVIGRPFWDTPWWAHSPELRDRLRHAVSRAAKGETVRFEATHLRPGGQVAYVDFSLKPVHNERGEVTMLIPEGRDITERRQAEQALAVSEARLRTLIESAPEAIVVYDVAEGRFSQVNQQACLLFAMPADELRQSNPLALSPEMQPDGRRSAVAAEVYLEQAIAGGTPVFEWRHRTATGREIPCEVRLVRLPDPSRVLLRGSVTDISDRLELEQQVRQSQKMQAIGQLAGGVAHDFNNLLTVISGYSAMLGDELEPQDPRREFVNGISDASMRAAWLTNRLLAFSRRAIMAPQIVDLNSAVGDAESMLRRVLGEDIQLSVSLYDAPALVTIDPGQWSQIILNLAINAQDAMPSGGRLTIATSVSDADDWVAQQHPGARAGRYARLTVADTGHGMSPEVIERLFEPFFTTKPIGKGTGLGLAVVHGIVTQAGGFIDVDSTLGVGTTFIVSLPLVEADPRREREPASRDPSAGAPPAAAAGLAGRTILLAEDEEGVRRVGEAALRHHGAEVLCACNGPEALRILDTHQHRIDLLVTDIVMPGGMNGHQLSRIARMRFPDLKTLFISGYIDDVKLSVDALSDGEAFLQKPFTLSALAKLVQDLIGRA